MLLNLEIFRGSGNRRFSPEGHKRLAGLSEGLFGVSGDSWGFAEGGVSHKYKVLMIFVDIHKEIFSLISICNDKIGIT